MKAFLLLALACTVTTGVIAADTAPALKEFTARYEASTNGIAGSARRILSRLDNGNFRLNNRVLAEVLNQEIARLEQISEFRIDATGIVPLNYSYQLSGVRKSTEFISYNWDTNTAVALEDEDTTELVLTPGVQDSLSQQLALRLAVAGNPTQDEFALDIIDGDEIETHHYRRVSAEVLSTPAGRFNTVKLERVREADDDRVTLIWLATDWDYLLMRIEQINGSGLHIELDLERATVGDEPVTGLAPQ